MKASWTSPFGTIRAADKKISCETVKVKTFPPRSHDSTRHNVRSFRPSAGKFLALSLDDLTLWHAKLRRSWKTTLL